VDPRAGVGAAVGIEGAAELGGFGVESREIDTLVSSETETLTVDVWWADDGGVQLVTMMFDCFLDDPVDVAM
jgi:hypothetical protein